MKEISNIIAAYYNANKLGIQTALATVVHVQGSSYRRPGARMLITEQGQLTGAISGGCLEGDALRKALLVMAKQQPMLVTYDTMDEDDAKFGVGLGCNGIIQVLIEPLNVSAKNNPIQLLEEIVSKRQQAILVTLFSLQNKKEFQQGTCLLLKEDGTFIEKENEISIKHLLKTDAAKALSASATFFKNYISEKATLTVFYELVQPTISLVIIGGGNDVVPLVQMASVLGWQTTVADGRAANVPKEKFVNECQVIVSKPENILSKIKVDNRTVFLLMTHNYNYDKAMLKELINKEIVFIGILGPKKKSDRMLGELKEEGMQLTAQQLSVIHSPVGFDIGAETPEEIALSILAEINTVLSNKSGKPLSELASGIHSIQYTAIEEVRVPLNL